MFPESHEPSKTLSQAAEAMRSSAIQPDALLNAETVILKGYNVRPRHFGKAVWWGAGLTAAALAGIAILTVLPSRGLAADMIRIAENGDNSFRHQQTFDVQPDGSLKLVNEVYSDPNRTLQRIFGYQVYWDDKTRIYVFPDGTGTVEHVSLENRNLYRHSAKELIDEIIKRSVVRQSGIDWHGVRADRYTADDPGGPNVRQSFVLIADEATQRPLEMDLRLNGQQEKVIRWDYPPLNPKLLQIQIPADTKMLDINAEHAAIEQLLTQNGPSQTVAGVKVELLQLWADSTGHACAITHADYAYPDNYGILIDDLKLADEPKTTPFEGQYAVYTCKSYKNRSVQLFFNSRSHTDQKVSIPDKVTVRIPVFKGKKLVGYAVFTNVQVHRAWDVQAFLGSPFFEPTPRLGTVSPARRG
jgi:hypothetical protein